MKALFVGLGSIGQRHLRNLKSLNSEIELLAVRSMRSSPVLSDTNQVINGVTIAEHYNIKEFDSLELALEQQPELVFVTNPTSLHLEVTAKALAADAFVFVEKPLSHEWSGIEALIKAEKEIGQKRIALGYQFRFHPALQLIKKTLDKGSIGRIVNARLTNCEYMPGWHPYEDYRKSYAARRELGGGALVTQIHDFDYAMWLFGLPERIFSVGGKLSELEVDVEDSVQVLMECKEKNNVLPVTLSLDYLQWPPSRTISIVGDQGSIHCDLIKTEVVINRRVDEHVERHTFPNFNRNKIFIDEMRNFLGFSEGKNDPEIDLERGATSLRIALAARNSIDSGNVVKL